MKRNIILSQGIIGGTEKDIIEDILPQLEGQFRQRKTYYEYYFDEKEIELTLFNLDELSNSFEIRLYPDELIIIV